MSCARLEASSRKLTATFREREASETAGPVLWVRKRPEAGSGRQAATAETVKTKIKKKQTGFKLVRPEWGLVAVG
jgi:hypothetical protein